MYVSGCRFGLNYSAFLSIISSSLLYTSYVSIFFIFWFINYSFFIVIISSDTYLNLCMYFVIVICDDDYDDDDQIIEMIFI